MASQERQMTDDAPAVTSKKTSAARALLAQAVTINRPSAELFAYFRDLTNLPKFMDNIISIEPLDDRRSHWTVKAPAGGTVEWTSSITEEVSGRSLSWQSDDDAQVPNSGKIEFRDTGARGTVVTATIAYDPPAGVIGKVVAKLFQREPSIQTRRDLRRFKQLMETGEIATASWTREQHEEEIV
jgi:uncharacterized membrane protein